MALCNCSRFGINLEAGGSLVDEELEELVIAIC
jgi:hypothetical protein